jgi:hypothetical protein
MPDDMLKRSDTMRVGMLSSEKGGERFPMSLFRPHEAQAKRNHYQTLDQLESRGGLGWSEAAAILEDRKWQKMERAEAEAIVRALASQEQS